MKLMNILRKDTCIGWAQHDKYLDLISVLIDELIEDDIDSYTIEPKDCVTQIINLTTNNSEEKEIVFSRLYDSRDNKTGQVKININRKSLIMDYDKYETPIKFKLFNNTPDYFKYINIEIPDSYEKNPQVQLNIHIENKFSKAQDKIDTQISYTTNYNNLDKVLDNIITAPQYVDNLVKKKVLK